MRIKAYVCRCVNIGYRVQSDKMRSDVQLRIYKIENADVHTSIHILVGHVKGLMYMYVHIKYVLTSDFDARILYVIISDLL